MVHSMAPPTGRRNFQLLRAGQRRGQSPIAIPNIQPTTLPKIEFDYNSATFLVENINYATEILAPTASGSPTNSITLNGDTYNLVQIHFHFPAEHTLPGVRMRLWKLTLFIRTQTRTYW
jgi:carbonic anhydrase